MAFNSISTSNCKNKYDTASSKSSFESASGVLKIIEDFTNFIRKMNWWFLKLHSEENLYKGIQIAG